MAVETDLLSSEDGSFVTGVGTWTAGSNTTIARVTSPTPHSGSGCLRLTSTAAGAMSASTGKYAVDANTVYEAYGYAANVVAAAGRVIQIQIDWYTSGDVFISSSTGSPTTTLPNSTAWTGPCVVIGTSPSTAAKAALKITVTAGITAGGQQIVVDSFDLGTPWVEDGNLFPYDASSVEMNTSGWTVSNGTLARVDGASDPFYGGSYSLRATSTASGNMTLTAVTRVPVVVGTAYEMFAWVKPPAAGRSLILEVAWYTAASGGTLVSTSSRTPVTVQTTVWERHTVLGTAPATATHAEVRLRPQTTGAAEVWQFDAVALRVQPLIDGNLLPYSAQSFEVGVADWMADGNCTVQLSAPADDSVDGAYALKATATAVGQARVELAAAVPVTAGVYYNAAFRFRSESPPANSVSWVDIDWYSASMEYLASAEPDQESVLSAGAWWPMSIGRLAPPGAAFAKLALLPQATVPGQVFFFDQVSLAAGDPPYIVEPQSDTGSVAITLNVGPVADFVNLWRVDPDGSLAPVRGFGSDVVNYPVTGDTMVFTDYEAPLGVPLRYQYSRTPYVGTTRTYSVTVAPPDDPGHVWFTDPGQPGKNMLLTVSGAPNWKRSVERGVYRVRGAKRAVVVSDVRADREGDLTAVTFTEADADALSYLLDDGSVLLIRARPGWGLDKVYVSVGDLSEDRVSRYGPEWARRWTLPLTVVDRPIGGMAGSADRTWQDILDDVATPTWGDVRTANATWLDVLQGVD